MLQSFRILKMPLDPDIQMLYSAPVGDWCLSSKINQFFITFLNKKRADCVIHVSIQMQSYFPWYTLPDLLEERFICWILCCFSCSSRPTSLQDRGRDSDDEDFRDRDYDVAALASNLSQAFKYGIYSNEDIDEVGIIFLNGILTAKI
jgi:hypothetical protein